MYVRVVEGYVDMDFNMFLGVFFGVVKLVIVFISFRESRILDRVFFDFRDFCKVCFYIFVFFVVFYMLFISLDY